MVDTLVLETSDESHTSSSLVLGTKIVLWCNWMNTQDFDSCISGSSPDRTTGLNSLMDKTPPAKCGNMGSIPVLIPTWVLKL